MNFAAVKLSLTSLGFSVSPAAHELKARERKNKRKKWNGTVRHGFIARIRQRRKTVTNSVVLMLQIAADLCSCIAADALYVIRKNRKEKERRGEEKNT